jgi:hypothetical protein
LLDNEKKFLQRQHEMNVILEGVNQRVRLLEERRDEIEHPMMDITPLDQVKKKKWWNRSK